VLVRHRTWTVGDLLAETRARLVTVTAEDRTVAAVFDLSYRNLPADRQRVFRHLGLHPGTEIDVYAAAALAGVPSSEATGHLDALHADNLLVEVGYHRFAMHDLIHRYARGLVSADPARQREDALTRLVDYYRYTATVADGLLTRYTRPTPVAEPSPAPATGTPDLADATRALAWIRAERQNLLACLATTSDPGQVVALTAGLTELLRRDGPWPDAIAAQAAAARAAEQLGDRLSQANALSELATLHVLSGNYGSGTRAGQQALETYRLLGSRRGVANALTRLGNVWRMDGNYPAAGQALEQALAIYGELGDRLGQANALTYHGTVWYMLDEYAVAAQSLRNALGLYRDLGDRLGEANALTYLGEVFRIAGDYPAAVETLHEALGLHRDLGDRHGRANTLGYLGSVHGQTGKYEDAGRVLKEALDLYRDLGDRLGQANSLDRLALARLSSGNHPGAASAAQEALDLFRDLDNRHGTANGVMRLGQIRLAAGDYQEAGTALEAALVAYRSLADRSGEAEALNELGVLHRRTGNLDRARENHLRAAELATQIDSHWDQASARAGIGRCDLAAGRTDAGVEHLRTALAMFQRIGAAEVSEVAADLDAARAYNGGAR
jgi:tetratricopeptide (TPR) repeat protein